MVRANKRSRPDSIEAEPSEPVEVAAKRSRGGQPRPPPVPQQEDEVADMPALDRREVMADVARRYGEICILAAEPAVLLRNFRSPLPIFGVAACISPTLSRLSHSALHGAKYWVLAGLLQMAYVAA